MTQNIPTVPEIINRFEQEAKNPNTTMEDLTVNLGKFLEVYQYFRTPYNMKFDGVFRARAQAFSNLDEACKEFDHTDKLRYPPIEYTRSCRCNEDYEPVFYCSTDSGVPVFEVRPKVGDFVVLACFKPKRKEKLELMLPIIGVKQIRDNLIKKQAGDPMIKILEGDIHYKSVRSKSLLIDDYIANWFVTPITKENKHIYRLTTAFYKVFKSYVTYDDDKVSSMIYPSVESGISGYNIVMETEVFDKELELDHAVMYQLVDYQYETYNLRPLMNARQIGTDGIIDWSPSEMSDFTWDLHPDDYSVRNLMISPL